MTGMEAVLAMHLPIYRWSPVYEEMVWACSRGVCDVLGSLENAISHQAAELAESGYGSQCDAWDEGHAAGWSDADLDATNDGAKKTPNPYPETKGATS